ncbi:MAG: hypothetical protein K2W95_09800 [Candidatus Obscuribacterales bacterium]|nr:hypothetical protein [Candidatus Obscuribacterales bacterium]
MSDTIVADTIVAELPTLNLMSGEKLINSSRPDFDGFHTAANPSSCSEDCQHDHGGEVEGDGEGDSKCRRHIVRLPGAGRQKFPMPTDEEVTEACRDYIQEVARVQRARAAQAQNVAGKKRRASVDTLIRAAMTNFFAAGWQHGPTIKSRAHAKRLRKALRRLTSAGPNILKSSFAGIYSRMAMPGDLTAVKPHRLIPVVDTVEGFRTGDPTLWAAAGGLAELMHDGRFEHHIAEVFAPHIGACDWARANLDKKYQETVESLTEHFNELIGVYRRTAPVVMHMVWAQYPDASEDQCIDAAVTVINQKLAEILYVLSIWTDSFIQQRDGKCTQLLHVIFTLEQSFQLFTPKHGKMKTMHVGDVFMARFGPNGPATIPGARGPVGAHAIEVPHDEREIIALMLPIYLHEFRHDYYADVEGLPEEMAKAVVEAIQRANAAGKFKFSSPTVKLGKQDVPTLALGTQICVQTLSETDADVAGGMLLSGPAFLYSLIATFSAFNSKGQSIFNVNNLLRSVNRFGITEENDLVFAPHMPDYPRAYFAAAALDLALNNGNPSAEGDECRRLADQASGDPMPKFATWVNGDPKSKFKFKIQMPFADLIQFAPVVADAIMNSKLECLGGMSTAEYVNWTAHRQSKVDRLVKVIMDGGTEIPADMGDVFATYVAAAGITAYWGLCKAGMRPRIAIARCEKSCRAMLDTLRKDAAVKPVTPDPVTPAA